ncbi:hypothetical protein Tco_0128555 [Tanacetum coccineum]
MGPKQLIMIARAKDTLPPAIYGSTKKRPTPRCSNSELVIQVPEANVAPVVTLHVARRPSHSNLDQLQDTTADFNLMLRVNKSTSLIWLCEEYSQEIRVLALEDDPTSSEVDPTYQDPEGDILLLEAILNSEPPPPPKSRTIYAWS